MAFVIKKKKRMIENKKAVVYDYAKHGVTQSLLGCFLECRRKCSLQLSGWDTKYSSMGLVYGSVMHDCLELGYEGTRTGKYKSVPNKKQCKAIVAKVEKKTWKENKSCDAFKRQMIEDSFMMAEATLPVYFDYWKEDDTKFKFLQVEGQFEIPFTDYKGRSTVFRGKRDGAFQNKHKETWLLEHKTKSMFNEGDTALWLPLDMQSNLYIDTLAEELGVAVKGVLYNVIRRVGLRQGKKETSREYALRCVEDIKKRPEWYFVRIEAGFDKEDIEKWRKKFYPLVTEFGDWVHGETYHHYNHNQCLGKYGRCKFINVCVDDDYTGLVIRDNMFNELEGV